MFFRSGAEKTASEKAFCFPIRKISERFPHCYDKILLFSGDSEQEIYPLQNTRGFYFIFS